MPASFPHSSPRAPILCLGEALVDLVSESRVQSPTAAGSFVAHLGGAMANVAVVASRAGASVALAGGAGADDWGLWLRQRLERERVDVSRFELVEDRRTLLALVLIGERGRPRYQLYGDAYGTVAQALGDEIAEAVEKSGALLINSNSLVGTEERAVTMRVREAALELGRPVVFDANLRLHRWRSRADATASANACVPQALLVTGTAQDAAWMTGEDDPEAAATALVKAGARMVVLSFGAGGAILRGELRADVPGVPARVLSTLGAGAAVTGTLVARLAESDFYPPSVAAGLPAAVEQAARAVARWGALD
jgi:fructokinase